MPEEINRVLTDHVSDILFVPTASAIKNLQHEGIEAGKVYVVGDVMFDAALFFEPTYQQMAKGLLEAENLQSGSYFVATLHRAENTDEPQILRGIVQAFQQISEEIAPVLWPVHPRTRKKMAELQLDINSSLRLIDPIGYFEMQAYLSHARGALTDSGGLQKEAAFQQTPALTLRHETEWPETVEAKCNTLVGTTPHLIVEAARQCQGKTPPCPAFGEGDAAQKIAQVLWQWAK